jgi:hypothetical protein
VPPVKHVFGYILVSSFLAPGVSLRSCFSFYGLSGDIRPALVYTGYGDIVFLDDIVCFFYRVVVGLLPKILASAGTYLQNS